MKSESTRKKKLGLLVGSHCAITILLATLAFCGFVFPAFEYVCFVITSSQFTLLAIWTAFATGKTRMRWATAVAISILLVSVRALAATPTTAAVLSTIGFFELSFRIAQIGFNRIGRFLLVCLILTALRHKFIQIGKAESNNLIANRFQFHLWHLMISVLAAGVIVTVGKRIHGFFGQSMQMIYTDPYLFLLFNTLFLIIGLVYSVSIALLSLWAALGTKRPLLPVGAAMLAAGMLSPIWPLLSQQSSEGFVIQAMVTIYQTMLVIGSLMIVRSCDCRLLFVKSLEVAGECEENTHSN